MLVNALVKNLIFEKTLLEFLFFLIILILEFIDFDNLKTIDYFNFGSDFDSFSIYFIGILSFGEGEERVQEQVLMS